jgi:hypothetical protein
LHHFTTDNAKAGKTSTMAYKQSSAHHFDKMFEMDAEPEEMNNKKPEEFCQKCPRESRWCKCRKQRDDAKQMQTAIITT